MGWDDRNSWHGKKWSYGGGSRGKGKSKGSGNITDALRALVAPPDVFIGCSAVSRQQDADKLTKLSLVVSFGLLHGAPVSSI